MTKLRLASAARPALMLVVEGPPWTSSALVSGPNSQNCAREVQLVVVLSCQCSASYGTESIKFNHAALVRTRTRKTHALPGDHLS